MLLPATKIRFLTMTTITTATTSKKLSSVSVVFPAYNEELNIENTILKAIEVFSKYFEEVEVIPVNDGSSDKTGEIIDRLQKEHKEVHPIHHPQNKGYGGAVKSGLFGGKNDYIFFSDSDGQFDLEEVSLLLPLIKDNDIAIGFRAHRADPWHRKLNAFCWGTLVKLLFGIKAKDIDCAFKLFKREVIDSVSLESNGAMVSTELLAQAGLMKFKLAQVGVSHYPRQAGEQTGANPWVILKAFIELFKLYGKLKHSTPAPKKAGAQNQ